VAGIACPSGKKYRERGHSVFMGEALYRSERRKTRGGALSKKKPGKAAARAMKRRGGVG